MALDTCDWSAPGADRYTGTATAAIHAFATIPAPVRERLIARHEKRAYDDLVYIDRDSIRGREQAWDPAIRDMHFGSRGKVCGRVDRSMWKSAQVESAVVYCDSGYCVAWPSVCGNWFVIAPQAGRIAMLAAAAEPPAGIVDVPDAGAAPVGGAPAVPPLFDGGPISGRMAVLGDSATAGDAEAWSGGGWSGGGGSSGAGGMGGGGGGGGGAAPTTFLSESATLPVAAAPSTVVITPIPEPSTWATLFAGLTALGALARHRRRRALLSAP